MDLNTKLILNELKSVQTNLTNRIDAVEHSIGARVGSLEDVAKVLDAWKPTMDASVAKLRMKIGEEMTALRKSMSRFVLGAT